MVGAVYTGGVVDGVGAAAAAVLPVFDAAQLGGAEVAAFAQHFGAHFAAVHAHFVVGFVAHVGMAFGSGFDVGADTAVVDQFHVGFEQLADELVGGEAVGFDTEPGFHFGRDGNGFGTTFIHTATLRNLRTAVFFPSAAALEQAFAFFKALGGTGVRIDEDVAVVEGGFEQDMLGQQHTVAEYVATHVADADYGEVFVLDVFTQMAEMAFYRFPRTACGDAHAFVVVAGAAAGGESVVQPEAVFGGEGVGGVGEGGGAFVGSHYQIGIIAVAAVHLLRRFDAFGGAVVGEVEQGVDEDLIAGDAFFQVAFTVGSGIGQLFAHETAFGAAGHDHGVFHHLCFHQAEHFGAEVVETVGPAQAAARHFAAAQVGAFHARAVHPNFKQRERLGQEGDVFRFDFQADFGFQAAFFVGLPEVGAAHRQNHGTEGVDDALFIQRGYVG